MTRFFALLCAVLTLAGCAINQRVDPLNDQRISTLCIEENKNIHMEGFLPTARSLIERKGVSTLTYSGAKPASCSHFMVITANWRWDMAMYLHYADFRVFDGRGQVGMAVYDARNGGFNMNKFGSTESKIAPLIDQLFGPANVAGAN